MRSSKPPPAPDRQRGRKEADEPPRPRGPIEQPPRPRRVLDLAVVAVDDQFVDAASDQGEPVVDLNLRAARAQLGRDAARGSVVARTDRGGKDAAPASVSAHV